MDEWILHIDGDGFFAYCEIARFPHLKGKPVVVGEDRGIVCACTYEAKALGISRATPIFEVREKYPEVTILSSHFELYNHYADMLASLLQGEVDILERYSIDECFALKRFPIGTTKETMHAWLMDLKKRIQRATGLTYSFGIARTKVLAKIASKREKPDGCTVIDIADETEVLKTTDIKSLWGIGWRLGRRFERMNMKTAYDFYMWERSRVEKSFAQPTQELWHELHGIRMFGVGHSNSHQKSLQATRSFTPTTDNKSFVIAELLHNADIAFTRMRKHGLLTNAISIYLKTRDKKYLSTSMVLPHYTQNLLDVTALLSKEARRLFQDGTKYRSTGITLWNLRPAAFVQDDLFGSQQSVLEKTTLMKAVDTIRHKHGRGSISVLSTMSSVTRRKAQSASRKAKDHYIYGLPLAYLGEVK